MKRLARIILLAMACSTAVAEEIQTLSLNAAPTTDAVMLSNGAQTLRLPMPFIKGARVVANSYSVLIDKNRHFSVETHTKASWNNPPVHMNDVPRMVVEDDFASVTDKEFKQELKGIQNVLIESTKPNDLAVAQSGDKVAYLIFSQQNSTVLIADRSKPDAFTQISIYGMNRKEIEENIIKGVMQ